MKSLKFWLLFLWCTYNPLPPLFPFRWSGFDSLYEVYPYKRPETIDSVMEMWGTTGLVSLLSGCVMVIIPTFLIDYATIPARIEYQHVLCFFIGFMWSLRGLQLIKSRPIH